MWTFFIAFYFHFFFFLDGEEEEGKGKESDGFFIHKKDFSRMDLSTLKKQLDIGELQGMKDFKRKVLLMFANAVMFNSTGHDVNHYAKEMAADTLDSLKVHFFKNLR